MREWKETFQSQQKIWFFINAENPFRKIKKMCFVDIRINLALLNYLRTL